MLLRTLDLCARHEQIHLMLSYSESAEGKVYMSDTVLYTGICLVSSSPLNIKMKEPDLNTQSHADQD